MQVFSKGLAAKFERNNLFVYSTLGVLIAVFITVNIVKFTHDEPFLDYRNNIKPLLAHCDSPQSFIKNDGPTVILLCVSHQLTGYYRMLPFLSSVLILPSAFLLSNIITRNRLCGLGTVFILVSSPVVNEYSVSAAYSQFWTLGLIISAYLGYKKPILGILAFVFSAMMKPLSLAYIPILINDSRKRKLALAYCTILGIGLLLWFEGFYNVLQPMWNPQGFIKGMALWDPLLHNEWLVLPFLPFVLSELVLLWKRKVKNASKIFWWIAGILISMPFLQGFTNMDNQSYRFIPLIVFYSIGLGICLTHFKELHPRLVNEAKKIIRGKLVTN